MNRAILLELLKSALEKRRSLPIEITKIIEDEAEIFAAVNQSLDHAERVFMLKNILSYEAEDEEDLLIYLCSAFDDSTYYASLAMPLLRQLQESNSEFTKYDQSPNKNNADNFHCLQKVLLNSKKEIKILMSDVLCLMGNVKSCETDYESIQSLDDLIIWSEQMLECCARLLILGGNVRRIVKICS